MDCKEKDSVMTMEGKKTRGAIAIVLAVLMLLDFDAAGIFSGYESTKAGDDMTAVETAAPLEEPAAELAQVPPVAVTEAPSEMPSEVPSEVPTEGPAEAPTNAPVQAPTEATAQESTPAPADTPAAEPVLGPFEPTAADYPSFAQGYARTAAGNVRVYTGKHSGKILTRLASDSIVYVDSRFMDAEYDRLSVNFDTDQGIQNGYVDADKLIPLTEGEAASFFFHGASSGYAFYKGNSGLPLALLDVNLHTVATEEPAASPAPVFTQAPTITNAPAVSEAPTITDAPAVSEAPAVTDVPAVSEAPVVMDAPVAAETPVVTDMPATAEVPEEEAEAMPSQEGPAAVQAVAKTMDPGNENAVYAYIIPAGMISLDHAAVYLLAAPGTGAERITQIAPAAYVKVLSREGAYSKIVYEKHTGYVESNHLVMDQPADRKSPAVHAWMNAEEKVAYGDTITLGAMLVGFEGMDYETAWQYALTDENHQIISDWTDVEGANELAYAYVLTQQNAFWAWRVEVRVQVPDGQALGN